MAIAVESDLAYFDFIGSEAIGTWSTLAKRRWGRQPKFWSLKTEADDSTVNTADFFLVAIDILNVGDRIFVVEVTNRGASNEAFVSSRWHYVSAKTANSITTTTVSEGGGGDMSAATYDPQSVVGDAFDTDNHTDGSTNGVYTLAERSKLSGIETAATADQTGAEIKTAYEGEADTNAFTDAEKTKLGTIGTILEPTVAIDATYPTGETEVSKTFSGVAVGDAVLDVLPPAGEVTEQIYCYGGKVTGADTISFIVNVKNPAGLSGLTGNFTAVVMDRT